MVAFQLLKLRSQVGRFGWPFTYACIAWLACVWVMEAPAQDLSWVNSAMERSKTAQRESLPAWQYDPRVASSSPDAALNAITVVNPDRLVAVGDRGLILASTDGGRKWQTQNSLTSHNLYGVAFFDEQHGLAVGGTVQPLSQSSLGIVLVTSDAGKSWQVVSTSNKASLPRLTGISIEQRTIRVWGDYSSVHGSGVFESHDQGRSWQPLPAPLSHVQAVAGPVHGLVLGIDHVGRLAQVPHNPNRAVLPLAPPTAPIQSMIHTGTQWLAVGDCGTITTSADGARWVNHGLPLSEPARNACSFQCTTAIEQNLWVAGTPGSLLLHSSDAGSSWHTVMVDQSWSITAIQFVDRNRGWFTTNAGSIWATRDGGATWFAQRLPVKRLGLQAIASSAANISWPALANATWQARQATDLIAVYRENIEDAVDTPPDAPSTLSALGGQIGLVSASHPSQWPVPGSNVQLPALSNSDQQQATNLVHHLATRLRAGRPSVVLVDDLAGAAVNNESFAEIVSQAMWMAEHDQPSLSWLSRELHLAPWKTNKLLTTSTAERADFTISSEELLRDSGLAMQDVLAPVFGKQALNIPNSCLRCLQLSSGNSTSRQNLFSNQDRHADTTRAADLSKIGNMQLVMGRTARDKAWQALAPHSLNAEEELLSWSKKLDTVIQQTPKHECGAALLHLAQRCLAANEWERWSLVFERLSSQAPLSDASRYGSLVMLRMLASEEFLAWQFQAPNESAGDEHDSSSGTQRLAGAARAMRLANPQESDPFESPVVASAAEPVGINQASAVVRTVAAERAIAPVDAARQTALRRAVSEFNRLSEADRALVARPDLQLAHFARRRALAELVGEPAPDAAALQALTTKSWLAGWPQVAAQEFIMAGGRAERPAWSGRALRTAEPPTLDGLADDACWQSASAMELANPFLPPVITNDANKLSSQTKFAYDDEFFYGFVSCPNVSGLAPSETKAKVPRRYDMNLTGTDHIVLQLDTDRDYTSACELAINQAGYTYDRCCQHSQWNPSWKVCVHESGSTWSAEFAIRMSDLTTRQPVVGTAWAISAFRYVPNWGVQSWSQLRSTSPRAQGNGLLVFE